MHSDFKHGYQREGTNWISLGSLRNAGVLSVGSLHVCLGALHVSAVVKGILVRRIQEAIQLCTTSEGKMHCTGTLSKYSRSTASRRAANIIRGGVGIGLGCVSWGRRGSEGILTGAFCNF